MRGCGVIGIARPTSIGGMKPWYFTCSLQRRVVVRTENEAEVETASHRSDQGDEVVEKSSAERRASRTRRNGCGVPPCTMHEICWGNKRLGAFGVVRQTNVQRQGAGWRARILAHHRRRHGGFLGS